MIDYQRYAVVIVRAGINLKKGQNLLIVCNPGNYDLARALGLEAYRQGAGYATIRVEDNHLLKARMERQEGEQLEFLPAWTKSEDYEMLGEDWARVRIDSTEEMDVLKGVDAGKLGTLTTAVRRAHKTYMRSMMRHEHPWCVVCGPGPRWAAHVLGSDATTDDLWKALIPILKLDAPDPVGAWREHGEMLAERRDRLAGMKLDSLRFLDEGTDLTVGLTPTSMWRGGGERLPDGRWTIPNIPTEEVFTTPDWRRTQGTVRCTRPVKVMENQVLGAWFRFENGRVAEFRAEEGADILARFLDTDPGARCVGELALVDSRSAIATSGLTFGSILYDENASCHIALGAGYPSCLSNAAELTGDDALREAGCNVSLVHTDFMVAASNTRILGVGADGREVPIMEAGRFAF